MVMALSEEPDQQAVLKPVENTRDQRERDQDGEPQLRLARGRQCQHANQTSEKPRIGQGKEEIQPQVALLDRESASLGPLVKDGVEPLLGESQFEFDNSRSALRCCPLRRREVEQK